MTTLEQAPDVSAKKALEDYDLAMAHLALSWQLRNQTPTATSHFRAGKAHQLLRKLRPLIERIVMQMESINELEKDTRAKAELVARQAARIAKKTAKTSFTDAVEASEAVLAVNAVVDKPVDVHIEPDDVGPPKLSKGVLHASRTSKIRVPKFISEDGRARAVMGDQPTGGDQE